MPSSNASNNKRSQQRSGGSKSSNKAPRSSSNNHHPSSLNAPVTTATSASKRVAKAVRSGTNKSGHKSKTNNKKAMDGPEAERSDDEDVVVYPNGENDDSESDDDVEGEGEGEGETTPEPEVQRSLGERVVVGVEGKSVHKKEIGMDALLAGAKARPESHNISRGYEFISSPASRLIIPADKIMSRRMARHDSIASNGTAFTDDSEWEKVQFEMEASVDAFSDSESLSLSQRDISRKKKAYAEVVKRTYPVPVAAAS